MTPPPSLTSSLAGFATVAVLSVAAVPSAPAQDAPAEMSVLRLTLEEARERARASAPSLEQARALERAARADVDVARAAARPQVELTAGYTRQSDVPELVLALPGAPPRTIFPNIPDNYRTRLGAALPLYTGGRLAALARAARSEAAAAGEDVATAGASLLLETTRAYWDLVTARESERVLAESLAAYEAHLADARHRHEVGLAARNEVLAVQVERDRAELVRLRAANAAAVAEADLGRLVGATPSARIEPAEPLATPGVMAPGTPEATPLEALVEEALARRPERTALRERIAASDARLEAERAARRPQVTVAGGFDYANPNRRILPPTTEWDDSWDLTLNMTWSLFDGGRSAAAARRAAARTDALRQQAEDVDRRIRLEVTQRRLELEAARRGLEVAARNVDAARENSRVASERHRAGVIPSSERLDAEVLLLRAGLDHTEALAQLRTARAALDRARGR
ncbi:MAG TPA: TolC family protein [Vicinamibacteria bacterium]|nr:TolC family protein [Vicinamibacteria bacterium]